MTQRVVLAGGGPSGSAEVIGGLAEGGLDWMVEHRIDAPLALVEATVLAPGTLQAVVARQHIVARAYEVERTAGPGWTQRVADFEPALPEALLPRIIDREWISWEETVRWDTAAHHGTFQIRPRLPESLQARFVCEGRYALHGDGGGTVRRVTGRLVIRAPLIGAAIEAWVADRLEASFEQEADVVQARARALVTDRR